MTIVKLFHEAILLPFRITQPSGSKSFTLRTLSQYMDSKCNATAWRQARSVHAILADNNGSDDCLQRYQEYAYFHPFVQQFLYNQAYVSAYQREDITNIKVTGKYLAETLHVERCELYLFDPDIGIVLLEVSGENLPLEKVQNILDILRRIYPPYFGTNRNTDGTLVSTFGGHCADTIGFLRRDGTQISPQSNLGDAKHFIGQIKDANQAGQQLPWAKHWQWLIEPFAVEIGTARPTAIQLGDDRCPVMAYLAIDNPRHTVTRGDMIRLCFADQPGKWPLPNAGRFLMDFEKRFCYDRFWGSESEHEDLQSRIMICGYAYTYIGDARDKSFFVDKQEGAHAIFRHLHIKMGLIAIFQKASLLSAAWRLSRLIDHDKKGMPTRPNPKQLDIFYRYFMMFSQKYWFHEISPQEQACELFGMWRRELGTQALYDEVRQELQDIVQHEQTTENTSLAELAAIGLPIAFALSLLGMSDFGTVDKLFAHLLANLHIINAGTVSEFPLAAGDWVTLAANIFCWLLVVLASFYSLKWLRRVLFNKGRKETR